MLHMLPSSSLTTSDILQLTYTEDSCEEEGGAHCIGGRRGPRRGVLRLGLDSAGWTGGPSWRGWKGALRSLRRPAASAFLVWGMCRMYTKIEVRLKVGTFRSQECARI